jgi:hypothetical protein
VHRLAEDVKLSAHGRHPTVYPFNCVALFLLLFFFLFSFLYYFWFFFAETNGVFSSSLGVCYAPHQSNKFLSFQFRSARSIKFTLGTMFRLSLGVREHSFTTPCLGMGTQFHNTMSRLKKKKKKKKKKKVCVYSCYL